MNGPVRNVSPGEIMKRLNEEMMAGMVGICLGVNPAVCCYGGRNAADGWFVKRVPRNDRIGEDGCHHSSFRRWLSLGNAIGRMKFGLDMGDDRES